MCVFIIIDSFVFRLLLDHKVDMDIMDHCNETPFALALRVCVLHMSAV